MSKELEYRTEKAKAVKRMRELLDRAEAEGRELDAVEREEFDRLEKRAMDLEELANREARLAAMERELEEPARAVPEPASAPEERTDPRGTKEYREAFLSWVRAGKNAVESRDLYKGSLSAGGYLVPVDLEARIIEKARESSVMRQLGQVITLSTDTDIPVEGNVPSFAYIAEKGAYGETDASFAVKQLRAYKAGAIVKVSEELLADSAVDLIDYLGTKFGQALADLENSSFVAGNGSGKPRGFILDATVGVTAAATGAITFDEVRSLPFKLHDAYQARAAFIMHKETALAIALLKDSNGQYYWSLQEQVGRPRTLLGYPVYTVSTMPTIATAAKVIALGDFSNYLIAERQGMTIQKLVELYSGSGQIGFRVNIRHDGLLLLAEAVQLLQMKTS